MISVPGTQLATAQGIVKSWGSNANGSLGDGTYSPASNVPVSVPGLGNVVAVSAGQYHSLALKTNGTVWAWGDNSRGQLGDGSFNASNLPVATQISGVVAIAAGGPFHSLALKNDGTVWQWGAMNTDPGTFGPSMTTPQMISGLSGIVAIARGYTFALALKNDGSVWAWGGNNSGQLGDGANTTRLTPGPVTGLSGVTAIAADYEFALALKSNGDLFSWGSNMFGALGIGPSGPVNLPAPVPLTLVSSISVGLAHALAVRQDGSLWSWGLNGSGQLGNGTTANGNLPAPTGLTNVSSVRGGVNHSLALKSDGSVWAWGQNSAGQLGNGTNADSLTPVAVPGLSGAIAIAAGFDFNLVVVPGTPPPLPSFRWVVVNGHPTGASTGLVKVSPDGSNNPWVNTAVNGTGVVLDRNGDFIVASPGSGLLRVHPSGAVFTIATIPGQAISVAIDAAGNFIVADNVNHGLWRVSPTGSKVFVANYPIDVANQLESVGVVVDRNGSYIVAHSNGSHANLAVITPAGAITPIAITGAIPSFPGPLTLDENGNYMVLDFVQRAIFRITPAGASTIFAQNSTALCCNAAGIARDPSTGEYAVTLNFSQKVQKVSADGSTITTLASGAPQFGFPSGIAVIPPTTVAITIDSNPSGATIPNTSSTLFVTGDGCEEGAYNAPVTLNWVPGASCTVRFTAQQPVVKDSPASVSYQFAAWEDGNPANPRTFTAPPAPTFLKANFNPRYLLSVAASGPGATVTGGGYYDPGTTATVSVTPFPIYRFVNWTGPVALPSSPTTTVLMNGPRSVTAHIEPKPVASITLGNLSQTYSGGTRPATAVTNPAGLAVSFTYNGSPNPPVNAGSYTVLASINDANYQGSANGTLTVHPAPLAVKANDVSRPYDSPNPAFTATYSGFVNGETFATSVGGSPSLATEATSASLPGTYPIVAQLGSLAAANYSFTFTNGTLTVTPTGTAPLTGSGCNGAYNGSYGSNVTVLAGQTCIFVGGGINGNTTLSGGTLVLRNATLSGNLQGQGSVELSANARVTGNVILSGGQLSLTGGATVGGQVALTGGVVFSAEGGSIGKAVAIDGGGAFSISTAIGGNLTVQNVAASSGPSRICGTSVNGNLGLSNNGTNVDVGAPGSCPGNIVGGQFQVQLNTGSLKVYNNNISGNLQCSGNTLIVGAGNTAKNKQGQCAAF